MTPVTLVSFDGVDQTINEWALDYGLTPGIIIARLQRGISIEDALTKPMKLGFVGQKLPVFHTSQRGRKRISASSVGPHSRNAQIKGL